MSLPNYSIIYSAPTVASEGTVQRGQVLIPSDDPADDGRYVVSTTANRGTRRSVGVALATVAGGAAVEVQQHGVITADVSGLAAGTVAWARVSATGWLERVATPSGSDDVCGRVHADGSVTLLFGVLTPDVANASGSGAVSVADDIAENAGVINRVEGLRGRPLASTAPTWGQTYAYDETAAQFKPRKPVPPSWYDVTDPQFGADPTGVADSSTAINAAIHVAGPTGGIYPGSEGATVYIPRGTYKLSSSIIIDRGIILQGDGTPGYFSGTVLKADDGVTAIVVSNGPSDYVTPPGAGGGPGDGSGAWSIVRQLSILGPGGGTGPAPGGSVANCHGLDILAACTFEHLYISGFSGNGINLDCSSGIRGNANTVRGSDTWTEYCDNGVFIDGADVNACTFVALSATNNANWQIWDSSFLGNAHIGHHVRGDGLSGQKAYKSEGAVNASVWIGCYSEEGTGYSEFDSPAVVIGGLHGTANRGTASCPSPNYFTNAAGYMPLDFAPAWTPATAVFDRYTVMTPPYPAFYSTPYWFICETAGTTGASEPTWGSAVSPGSILTDGTATWRNMGPAYVASRLGVSTVGADALAFTSGDALSEWRLTYALQTWRLRLGGSDNATALTLGSNARYPGVTSINFPTGIRVGDTYGWTGTGRRISYAAAAPTTGFHRRGDLVLNNAATSTTPGWICTTSGQSDAADWDISTYYVAGNMVKPTTPNGYVYQCVRALGTNSVSGAIEPTWPTTLDVEVNDEDLTWICAGVDTGPVFANIQGSAAAATTGTATVDFGAFPGNTMATVDVTGQTGIVTGSTVRAWIRAEATANNSTDEHIMAASMPDVVAGPITAGVGFTIYVMCRDQGGESLRPPQRPRHRAGATTVAANQNRPEQFGSVGGKTLGTVWGQFTVAWEWV